MNDPIEQDQSLVLAEAAQMYRSEPFKRLKEFMAEQVEEAYEAMIGNISSDPMMYMRLQLRWQQREVMLRSMLTLASSTIEQHEKEVEEYNRAVEQLSQENQ